MLMRNVSRRRFLQLAGGSVAATMLSDSIARALAIPANRATRSLKDIEHIVVLMQENRSFDHYFGVLRGVRGFGDPHPVTLPSGKPVWHQADGSTVVLPFRPEVPATTWRSPSSRTLPTTGTRRTRCSTAATGTSGCRPRAPPRMAHLERKDLPFHYALADAFTVCDGYHCSMLGPTDTNRYYMWTGWDGNDGQGGGPVIANDELGYGWQTYPERLQDAGISWKIYQDIGDGLDAGRRLGLDDGCVHRQLRRQLAAVLPQLPERAPGQPAVRAARTGTDVNVSGGFFDILAADVKNGKLPSVSWVVAPEGYTEHPAWPAGYGAWYTAGVLNALTSDPEVWSKTALLITFDENDGFFDHVVGPYPNVGDLAGKSTVPLDNELFERHGGGTPGGPRTGSSDRTASACACHCSSSRPGARGGWVCSETFDHTSLIRFIEARFGVGEPNITPWRRAVCGDLTSAFDFESTSDRVPKVPPVVDTYNTKAAYPSYHPAPPAVGSVPTQEPGVRPSRRLGYRLRIEFDAAGGKLHLAVKNQGSLGVGLQARSLTVAGAPYSYTVGAGHQIAVALANPGTYDLSLHGPNGFFRHFAGSPATAPRVEERADDDLGTLTLRPDRSPPSSAGGRRNRRRLRCPTAPQTGRAPERSRSTPTIPAAGTTSR